MAIKEHSNLRVLMFPWLAYGHISPYLELAKKLSKRNFHIYFCSTPVNLNSIKTRLTPSNDDFNAKSLELVELHLPTLPNLPPHLHTTNGLPPELDSTLVKAADMARPNFEDIMKDLKPDLIIYDVMQSWVSDLASWYAIPAVHLQILPATALSYIRCMFGGKQFPSPAIFIRPAEIKIMTKGAPKYEEGEDPMTASFKRSCEIVLIQSSKNFENEYIDFLSDLVDKKVVPVGPLIQAAAPPKEEDDKIMEWLNRKEADSTVLVSFGSQYYLSKEELEELAYGLELSQVNFVWVIRFPKGEEVKAVEVLPQGFMDRVGDRGLLVEGWAPQTKILEHSSIGGFVSHCGWNSATESMSLGVPIIAIPMVIEQPLNCRRVVELGVGMEVMKDENSEFDREEVARVIREVVVEKSGEEIRRKAKELSENVRHTSDEEVNNVAQELRKLCNKKLDAHPF
nr:rhamnosyltransferase GT1 [Centella asiatica]